MIEIPLDISLAEGEIEAVRKLLGREPSDVELQIFDVLWSEHCSYKSSKPMLKKHLPVTGPTVVQGPEEDAGILSFTEWQGVHYGVVIGHESHNHPSQILPVEGAATGIGGVVRDVICMGADLIGVLDPLRFGDPEGPNAEECGAIARGVVSGIAQYGNALGVPNLGGDLFFDGSFDKNCLVNVVALGLLECDRIVNSAVPQEAKKEPYVLVLVGKPTDSSGFGGATMASKVFGEDHEEGENRGAVQIPDPFLKRVLNVALREFYDRMDARRIPFGCKDLGAGGISCMASEIAERGGFGIELDLDAAPVAEDLPAHVLAVAETQERYGLAVPERWAEDVLKLFNEEFALPTIYRGACAAVIGRFVSDPVVRIAHKGELVCDTTVAAITTGAVADRVEGVFSPKPYVRTLDTPFDPASALLSMLGSVNGASAEPIFRSYDTEVMGNAVIRPGEADAAVILPVHGCPVGLAVTVDGNPWYTDLEPHKGAALAVIEAARNLAAVGATPIGLTDCLNYGSPEDPAVYHQFAAGVRGIAEAASRIGLRDDPKHPIPVVSGNVSFYNQSESGGAVKPSPIIAMVGTIADASRATTLRLKDPGNALYLVGNRYDDLGGTLYDRVVRGGMGGNPPKIRYDEERALIHFVSRFVEEGLVRSSHDISRGGALMAMAEMVIAGDPHFAKRGLRADFTPLGEEIEYERTLFGESGGFLLEIEPDVEERFRERARERRVALYRLAEVTGEDALTIEGPGLAPITWTGEEMRTIHQSALAELFPGV